MGVIVGIVALVVGITSATIFLMSNNNEVEVNKNNEQIENAEVNNEQIEIVPSGDAIVSGEVLKETFIPSVDVIDEVQEVENNTIQEIQEERPQETVTNIEQEVKVEQNNVVQEVVVQEEIETVIDNVVIPSDSVGMLSIPKISLYTPVRDGHSLEVLKTTLGHFDDTAYWQGNIGILGHNSGNAGYFKELTKLVVGDEVQYTTEYGTRKYKVNKIIEIDDTDWSMLANTTDNRITLITCVRGVPEKRLCIQANEIY